MKDANDRFIRGRDVIRYLGKVYFPEDVDDSVYMKQYSADGVWLVVVDVNTCGESDVFVDSGKVVVLDKENNPEWYI